VKRAPLSHTKRKGKSSSAVTGGNNNNRKEKTEFREHVNALFFSACFGCPAVFPHLRSALFFSFVFGLSFFFLLHVPVRLLSFGGDFCAVEQLNREQHDASQAMKSLNNLSSFSLMISFF
jgi:hypothetical protein